MRDKQQYISAVTCLHCWAFGYSNYVVCISNTGNSQHLALTISFGRMLL